VTLPEWSFIGFCVFVTALALWSLWDINHADVCHCEWCEQVRR